MSHPLKWPIAGLAVLTLVRLWVAAVTPLAPDEAYYWIWSRALAPGYLDHPPMVALWIWAGTALAGAGSIGVRLLGPFSAAFGSWLLYDAGERLFPGRGVGVSAAALLNATLALGAGAVTMTPDTPLLLFWAATLWAAARLVAGGNPAWWLAAGAFAGLALLSKYTAVFLPVGLLLFALLAVPRWWRRPEPFLGALLAAALFAPVVVWNADHDWIGFLRQGGRVADWRPARALGFLAELVGGQVGLATPLVFVLFAAGIAAAVRDAIRGRQPTWVLLAAVSVPPLLVFSQHALGDRVQGNWPVILYPGAALAAGALSGQIWRGWVWRGLVWPACGLGFVVTAVLYAHVVTGWPAWSGDPVARQLSGWDGLASRAEAARLAAGAAFIAAEPYGLAAELSWALPSGVVGVGAHWLPMALPGAAAGEGRGILIQPERYGAPDPAEWDEITPLSGVTRSANGTEVERYAVFLVRALDARPVGAILPHR
jgi:4-amino-4-deoxy-L-arabinose transferase-like glycosyltransferase